MVAAISAGGAGAVFWMWVIALFGSSTAFAEATLAQLYKERDPLYGAGGEVLPTISTIFLREKIPWAGKRSVPLLPVFLLFPA